MGIKAWLKDQREQAKADPLITAFFGGSKVLELHTHTIRSGQDSIPLSDVQIHIESGEELSSRVTATRLVAFGVLALAAKKKSGGEKFLTIEGGDQFWSVEVHRNKVNNAMKFLGKVQAQARKASSPSA